MGQLGWKGLENGELLAAAATRFDALISMDRRLTVDRDMAGLALGVVLVRARSNRIEDLRPLVRDIMTTLNQLRPGDVRWVGA